VQRRTKNSNQLVGLGPWQCTEELHDSYCELFGSLSQLFGLTWHEHLKRHAMVDECIAKSLNHKIAKSPMIRWPDFSMARLPLDKERLDTLEAHVTGVGELSLVHRVQEVPV